MIYLQLFLNFLQIGAFTFGGGYAMIPMMQEIALSLNWITEEELINFIAVSESTPGPFAVNMATYIGAHTGGIFGSFVATLGVVLPSFIIILIVARFYIAFKENKYVAGCMNGLRPTVVALISSAVISIGLTVFFPSGINLNVFSAKEFYISLFIFALALFLSKKKKSPIIIIIVSAVLGILAGYVFGL